MSNLAIVSTPFVLLDLYGVTVTYSEMGKQKGREGGGQFYDMRVKAIVQPFSILGSAHRVKKYVSLRIQFYICYIPSTTGFP